MKDKNLGIIQPLGELERVFYSDELLDALMHGYIQILNMTKGYVFEKKGYIFKDFITELYEKRLNYKKEGNKGMESLVKLMLNSLYGRFAIKSESNKIKIKDSSEYKEYIQDHNNKFSDFRHFDNINKIIFIESPNEDTTNFDRLILKGRID